MWSRSGVTDDDVYVAKLLYRSNKPVILAVNKVDDQKFLDNIYEFYKNATELDTETRKPLVK